MSDLLVVRGIDAAAARGSLDEWAASREWVRSVTLRDAWEPQQLEINRRCALKYKHGKHKLELAELVLRLAECGAQVIHVMLHRHTQERAEQDLWEWADGVTRRST